MKRNVSIIISITTAIAIIAFFGAGLFIVSNKFLSHYKNKHNIEIAGKEKKEDKPWREYQNKEYGFRFKYPSNLKLNFSENGLLSLELLSSRFEGGEKIILTKTLSLFLKEDLYDCSSAYYRYPQEEKIGGANFKKKTSFDKVIYKPAYRYSVEYARAIDEKNKCIKMNITINITMPSNRVDLDIDSLIEKEIELFKEIISTFRFENTEEPFFGLAKIDAPYSEVRDKLMANGWTPVIPDYYEYYSGTVRRTKPISEKFPEISSCGSGHPPICFADFKKGNLHRHLNLISSKEIIEEFIVTGWE